MSHYHEMLSHLQMFFGKKTQERLTPDELAALKRHESRKKTESAERSKDAEDESRIKRAA